MRPRPAAPAARRRGVAAAAGKEAGSVHWVKDQVEMAGVKLRLARVAHASYLAPMKTLSVKLPEALAKWLAGEARLTRRSRSALVREALEAKRNGRSNGAKGAPKPQNMAEALASLGGFFNGPTDLSTNPKHLEGFGK